VGLAGIAIAGYDRRETASLALQLDDVHLGMNGKLPIGPTRSWSTGEAVRLEWARTRTRLANSDRCSPSSKAELPPPMTTTSSAPL